MLSGKQKRKRNKMPKRPREGDNSQQATLTMMGKKKTKLDTSSSKHKKSLER